MRCYFLYFVSKQVKEYLLAWGKIDVVGNEKSYIYPVLFSKF